MRSKPKPQASDDRDLMTSPPAGRPPSPPPPGTITAGRVGMATILIVDDVSANRDSLVTLLHDHGHRLLEAADGSAALAAVHAEHPDLVITDVLMPVMDGYELVRQLRLDPATSQIPVVFYTAQYGEREARAHALSSGASDVLTKPAEPEEVLKIVGRVLAGGSETAVPPIAAPLTEQFNREHLRLLTDVISGNLWDLRYANARLRALINIGLELASERDADRLLRRAGAAARDLFGATYITLGIVDPGDHRLQRAVTCCGAGAADWIECGDPAPGILRTVVIERQTVRGDNPGGDPGGLQLPARHPAVHAFLAVPLASTAHVYGWLLLVGNEGRSFTEEDEHLALALAGQVGRIYELEHEISERKSSQSALRDERDRAQRCLDTADVVLLALNLDGQITLINRMGCDLLGWEETELVGRDWVDTCLPDWSRSAFRQQFDRLVGGDLSIIHSTILARSGEERLIEWRNTLLRDDAGCVTGTFSSGTDVTERTQAVEALRTAEERMRFALDSANVGIWDMDYRSGVLRWSETLEAHHGLRPGTFGKTFEAFVERIHPDDRASVLETIGTAMKSGSDFSLQNRIVWPDGTVRWLTGAGRILLGEHGEPVRGLGIFIDVTDRRALEAQYHHAQKMEAIGRLAGGVAHDFNNLLTGILGYCELLLADFDPDDPRQADIAEIRKAGASAAGLTRQLLAFSRREIIEPALLDLNMVMDDMRAMLGRLIGEDVEIVLRLRPELAPLMADRGQLEQIVMNLAVNARDAMPRGGRLTIETANVELDENYAKAHFGVSPGPYVALTVSDTGTGMTPDVQDRLFEPFFTTKKLGSGTGLGLATVHSIVGTTGGSINVYSEVGTGTSFKVYFPRADAAAMVVDTPPQAARALGGGETVLVVEDAEGLRKLTRRLLERQGYTVLVAGNADEALGLFEANASIAVLVTDVVMPGGSGPDLARQLIERRPALKVVYMSGYTEDTIVQHGIVKAGIAFVHKPFTSETLGRNIRDVLDGIEQPRVSLPPTLTP